MPTKKDLKNMVALFKGKQKETELIEVEVEKIQEP